MSSQGNFTDTLIADALASISKSRRRQLTTSETVSISDQIRTAIADDRERCRQICDLPEANGRSHMAHHLANLSNMSVGEARALLTVAPIEAASENPMPFAQFMDRHAPPCVGAMLGSGNADRTDEAENAARVASLAQRLGLRGYGNTER